MWQSEFVFASLYVKFNIWCKPYHVNIVTSLVHKTSSAGSVREERVQSVRVGPVLERKVEGHLGRLYMQSGVLAWIIKGEYVASHVGARVHVRL